MDGGFGAVAGRMKAEGKDQINVKIDNSTFSHLNSNRKLYLSKKNPSRDTLDYEEHMGARTNWLTKDNEIVDWYRAQPWCTFHFTPNGYYHMFRGMQKAHDINRMKNLPAGLPILFTSGAEDPVGAWGEGVRKAFMVYSENTECEVSIKLYDDDRHEILNETDRATVYADMLEFLDYCLEK